MKKMVLLSILIAFSIILKAQTVPVTFHFDANNSQYKTVVLLSDSLKDEDGDRIFELTKELPIGQFDYHFWIDNALGYDPANPEKRNGYDGSTMKISDPMITYLLPKDNDMMQENQIRADFAFSADNPLIHGSLTVDLNGHAFPNPESLYNSNSRTLIINEPSFIMIGENTLTVSYKTNKGTISRTSTFTYHPIKLMIDKRVYHMEHILGWGRVLPKPYPDKVYLKCNETVYESPVNENGYFGSDIIIHSNENKVSVAYTEEGLNAPIDEMLVNAELRHSWWVELTGTVNGDNVAINAIPHDIERNSLVYSWKESTESPKIPGISGSSDQITFQIPEQKGEYKIELNVTAENGTTYTARKIFINSDKPHFLGLHERSPWMETMTLYEIEGDYFDYQTQSFNRLKEALPHFKTLGVKSILIPPFIVGGYVTWDHFEIFQDINGTKEDLIDLVKTAHEYGLKIFFDIALGHMTPYHPFLKVNYLLNENSYPYNKFNIWEGEPGKSAVKYSDQGPNIIYVNLEEDYPKSYITKNIAYWLEVFDADGFRFDSGQESIIRSPRFMSNLLKQIKNIKPDCWIWIEGENRDNPEINYYDFGDACYDWKLNSEWGDGGEGFPGIYKGVYSIDQLHTLLNTGIPDSGLIVRYANIDYHDYFHNRYGWEQERTALSIVASYYGVLHIQQGEEVGGERLGGTINQSDPLKVMPLYKRLISMKKQVLGNYPEIKRLTLPNPNEIYAYTASHDTSMVVTVANFTGQPKSVVVNFNDPAFKGKTVKRWYEITDSEEKEIKDITETVTLQPWESKVFILNTTYQTLFPELKSIELINLSGKNKIDTDAEALRFMAKLTPETSVDSIEWILDGDQDLAQINEGILTSCGCRDGEVTVIVRSKRNPVIQSMQTISISNQKSGPLLNPRFDETINQWRLGWAIGNTIARWDNGKACLSFANNGNEDYSSLFYNMNNLRLEKGKRYKIAFDAFSTIPKPVNVYIRENGDDYETFCATQIQTSTTESRYSYTFIMENETSEIGNLNFYIAGNGNEFWLDNVSLCQITDEEYYPEVTFLVDMQNETVSAKGVFMMGNWDNWTTAVKLDNTSKEIYATTLTLTPGNRIDYKFINGDPAGDWNTFTWENFTGSCTDEWTNRFFIVPDESAVLDPVCFNSCKVCVPVVVSDSVNVTFQVDMQNETVSASGVNINGSFSNWTNAESMQLLSGGTVYAATLRLKKGETIEYKFINGGTTDWDKYEILSGLSCAFGNDANRGLIVPDHDLILDVVCFAKCKECEPVSTPNLKNINILLYPNPTSDEVEIRGLSETERNEILLISEVGQILKQTTSSGEKTIKINFTNFPKGIYTISIKNRTGNQHFKVLKK